MDRRHLVVQRTREIFGERLEDVVHMVRQDRQGLRGWEEPGHIRSVLRRSIREGGTTETGTTATAVGQFEFGRTAGEPERGQQREGVGQLLEVGANALEKVAFNQSPELTREELFSLECMILLYGRPSLLVQDNCLAAVPSFWNFLEDQREDIEMAQRGVGRIELFGHPEYDWAGTGFLVNETCLLTTRRTAEIFVENRNNSWQFRPGITAWMDYRSESQHVASAGYRVRSVIGVHDQYDLALLEVEPPYQSLSTPAPLALASTAPSNLEGRPVYLVSYPIRDARRNETEGVTNIFREVYNVKRVQPGTLQRYFSFRDVGLLQHDCAPLGQTTGGCLLDLETHQVLGLQLSSRYLDSATAIPLWVLRDDPLLQRAGVTFAAATGRDLESTTNQLERLARSRYWNEVRQTIDSFHQRAFGGNNNRTGTNP